ncbi:MAG: hypothetical protein MZW92_20785 [Comamonadaceae bacterium]|nr:hypothetical protein [Comamonadaceae bacterium]
MGRARGARGGEPAGRRGAGTEGDRPDRRRRRRPAAQARRPRRSAAARPSVTLRPRPGRGRARRARLAQPRCWRVIANPSVALIADDDRHLRPVLRVLQPGLRACPASSAAICLLLGAVRAADAAGELRRASALIAARHRADGRRGLRCRASACWASAASSPSSLGAAAADRHRRAGLRHPAGR